jgi:ubiquinone biosynthesis protein UbiJ
VDSKETVVGSKESDDYQLDVRVNALMRGHLADIEQKLMVIRGDTVGYEGDVVRVESRLMAMLENLESRLNVVFNMSPMQGYL